MRNREKRGEEGDRERREYRCVVRAYLRFFNLAFSMSARQTAAFCFELGRKQTMSAQRKELPTTLELFSGL